MKRVVYSQTSPIYNTINDQNGQPEESITQGKCNALCKLSYIHSTFSFLKLIGFGLSAKEDGDFKVQQLRIHTKKKKYNNLKNNLGPGNFNHGTTPVSPQQKRLFTSTAFFN